MKKQDIIDLIDAHVRGNDASFIKKSYEIAQGFYNSGEKELADYILSQLNPSLRIGTQNSEQNLSNSILFKEIESSSDSFILPEVLSDQLKGIINAVSKNIGISKFLFVGLPGTGKTEAVRQLGRILHRTIYMINFDELIDSRLGMTQKNLSALFDQMNRFPLPQRAIFLFDELDALALDRINSNDVREMGRVTSSLLKGLDQLNRNIMLIATTNLQKNLDKAISRRFDAIINFNQYTNDDLFDVANDYLEGLIKKGIDIEKDSKLLKKIINNSYEQLTPGSLKNVLRTSVAFGDLNSKDYLRRLYLILKGDKVSKDNELYYLKEHNFSLREMEILTLISRSELSRRLNIKDE